LKKKIRAVLNGIIAISIGSFHNAVIVLVFSYNFDDFLVSVQVRVTGFVIFGYNFSVQTVLVLKNSRIFIFFLGHLGPPWGGEYYKELCINFSF